MLPLPASPQGHTGSAWTTTGRWGRFSGPQRLNAPSLVPTPSDVPAGATPVQMGPGASKDCIRGAERQPLGRTPVVTDSATGEFQGLRSPAPRRPGSAAAAPWTPRDRRGAHGARTPPGRARSRARVRVSGRRAGSEPPRPAPRPHAQLLSAPRRVPGCLSMHLERGRLPDVAGGDAQQQEASEARRGQQQRRQQRQHLPSHGRTRRRTRR